jgi:hypothetical protein
MSLNITGNQANITTPITATVTAIANGAGGVWLVTTSAPHLFGNGDSVDLLLSISSSPVFAQGFVTIIDSTHFSVAGTTFTATGTGTAIDTSLTPPILVPTDGDPFSLQLSGMLSALQCLADRTQYLQYQLLPLLAANRRLGVALAPVYFGGSALEMLGHTASGIPVQTVSSVSTSGTPSAVVTVAFSNVQVGTAIVADLEMDYDTGTQTTGMLMALYGSMSGGAPFIIAGAVQVVPDSGSPLPAIGVRTRVSMNGVTTAPTSGNLVVTLYVFIPGASNTWNNLGGGNLRVSLG